MKFDAIVSLLPRSKQKIYCAATPISAGEAAEICTELEQLDLCEYITGGREGFYLIRTDGDSMEGEIRNGDWLITDTNQPPNNGEIIVASVNGDYLVKDYKPLNNGLMLVPKNEKYESRVITAKDDFKTFGVVRGIIRLFKKN